jgi:hypothetical protein
MNGRMTQKTKTCKYMYRIEKGWLKLWLYEREMETERQVIVCNRKRAQTELYEYILDQNNNQNNTVLFFARKQRHYVVKGIT